jgi:hypothetical protein
MRCRYCGEDLPLLKKISNNLEFCSDAHRMLHEKRFGQLAVNRLVESQLPAKPPPPLVEPGGEAVLAEPAWVVARALPVEQPAIRTGNGERSLRLEGMVPWAERPGFDPGLMFGNRRLALEPVVALDGAELESDRPEPSACQEFLIGTDWRGLPGQRVPIARPLVLPPRSVRVLLPKIKLDAERFADGWHLTCEEEPPELKLPVVPPSPPDQPVFVAPDPMAEPAPAPEPAAQQAQPEAEARETETPILVAEPDRVVNPPHIGWLAVAGLTILAVVFACWRVLQEAIQGG